MRACYFCVAKPFWATDGISPDSGYERGAEGSCASFALRPKGGTAGFSDVLLSFLHPEQRGYSEERGAVEEAKVGKVRVRFEVAR